MSDLSPFSVLCFLSFPSLTWPGGDLLSHALRRSTIGAEGFHGRVRDGIGCGPLAMTTRPGQRTVTDGGTQKTDVRERVHSLTLNL